MPAAYYELSVEQGSDYIVAFRILNPSTGKLFQFIPASDKTFWTGTTALNFDVPQEIKLAYPDNNNSFGWLRNPTNNCDFLQVESKVKNSGSTTAILSGTTIYSINSSTKKVQQKSQSGALNFEIVTNNSDYNLLLKIANTSTSASTLTGKYLYDIELTYNLGAFNATPYCPSTSRFVIRLLQGKMTFNPNITT
jgi:hypothetical protein